MSDKTKDLFGKAILDYQTDNNPQDLITETSISESDEMSVKYLFRSFREMPQIEKLALEMAKGHILDVGCGAGSHSLYLQDRKMHVTAIDISPNAIAACKLRGILDAKVSDINHITDNFDTILLLMNGAGMCGKLKNLPKFLSKLKSILLPGGQILLDSSDIIYMFDEDDDGGKWIPSENDYYGEVVFHISYKGENDVPFNWMYIDYQTLENAALQAGFKCEMVSQGEHYDYLARLSH